MVLAKYFLVELSSVFLLNGVEYGVIGQFDYSGIRSLNESAFSGLL